MFTIAGIIASSIIAYVIVSKVDTMKERFFDGSIALSAFLGCLYVVVLSVVWFLLIDHKHIKKILYGFVVFEVLIMGLLTIEGHGTTYYPDVNYGYTKNIALSSLVEKVNKDDKSYFRAMSSIASDSNKNDGARNGYNGVSFFHSVYNFNVKNFTYWSMFMTYKGGWSGRYIEKRAGIDKFLGIKYYFIEKDRVLAGSPNVSFGYQDITDKYPNNYYYVFEDQDHLNFALSYDVVYPYIDEDGENLMEEGSSSYAWTALRNDDIYLKGAVLEESDAEKVLEQSNGDIIQKNIGSASSMLDAKSIYRKNISSSWEAKTYDLGEVAKKMKVEDILNKINTSIPISPRPAKNEGLKHVIYICPKSEANEVYDPEGMAFYINAPFKTNQKEDIYLIGEDNTVITYDNHNDDRTSDTSTRRGPRGLYSRKINDEPAKKVKGILLVPRWGEFNMYEDVYYEGYSSFKENKLQQHIDNPIEDVIYKDNHFSFKTNYDKNRFVVTQIAYDKGWSVKAKLEDGTVKKLDTFIAQGGFVGFVAEKGNVTYSMDYYTPYLWGGTLLSVIGLFIFTSTLLGYMYLDEKNRGKYIEEFLNLSI